MFHCKNLFAKRISFFEPLNIIPWGCLGMLMVVGPFSGHNFEPFSHLKMTPPTQSFICFEHLPLRAKMCQFSCDEQLLWFGARESFPKIAILILTKDVTLETSVTIRMCSFCLPSPKLTVRPWKYPFLQGKSLPITIFQRRTVSFRECKNILWLSSCMKNTRNTPALSEMFLHFFGPPSQGGELKKTPSERESPKFLGILLEFHVEFVSNYTKSPQKIGTY